MLPEIIIIIITSTLHSVQMYSRKTTGGAIVGLYVS